MISAIDTVSVVATIVWIILFHGLIIKFAFPKIQFIQTECLSWHWFVLDAFILTNLINLVLLSVGFAFHVNWGLIIVVFVALDAILLAYIISRSDLRKIHIFSLRDNLGLSLLCVLIFIVMVRNGGVLEIIADSWWHMSKSYKFIDGLTSIPVRDHISGAIVNQKWFDPDQLWHRTLAMIRVVSNVSLPVIWHLITPWIAVFTVISYYYLAHTLLGNKFISLLSVILFLVLFGGINAGLRLSPWPGNVSYIFWYVLLALSIRMLDSLSNTLDLTAHPTSVKRNIISNVISNHRTILKIILLSIVIYMLHKAELFLYIVAIINYGLFINFTKNKRLSHDRTYVIIPTITLVIIFLLKALESGEIQNSVVWVNTILITLFIFTGYVNRKGIRIKTHSIEPKYIYIIVIITIGFFINWQHLYKLFVPDINSVGWYHYYIPEYIKGWFGEWVRLPKWEHQLRGGLLWGGLISIISAGVIYRIYPNRGTAFLFANSVIPFFILISPYPFTLFTALVPDYGVYRVQLLIFHPIILSLVIALLLDRILSKNLVKKYTW